VICQNLCTVVIVSAFYVVSWGSKLYARPESCSTGVLSRRAKRLRSKDFRDVCESRRVENLYETLLINILHQGRMSCAADAPNSVV
jgi:hypothetical protein